MANSEGGTKSDKSDSKQAEIDAYSKKIIDTKSNLLGLTKDEVDKRLLKAIYFPRLPQKPSEEL